MNTSRRTSWLLFVHYLFLRPASSTLAQRPNLSIWLLSTLALMRTMSLVSLFLAPSYWSQVSFSLCGLIWTGSRKPSSLRSCLTTELSRIASTMLSRSSVEEPLLPLYNPKVSYSTQRSRTLTCSVRTMSCLCHPTWNRSACWTLRIASLTDASPMPNTWRLSANTSCSLVSPKQPATGTQAYCKSCNLFLQSASLGLSWRFSAN